MIIDKYGAVTMEHSSREGNIGDAMSDTSRVFFWALVCKRYDITNRLNLALFRTEKGYLRHPEAPFKGDIGSNGEPIKDSWREDDTSGDQYQPWYRAMSPWIYMDAMEKKKEMRSRVLKNFCRYGNGDFIHPGFGAELANWDWAQTQAMNSQFDLFNLKWRWSDEHNKFEPNENSAADYINWFTLLHNRPEWLIQRCPKDLIKSKVATYYAPEKEKANWVIQLAHNYIDIVWSKK